MASSHHPVVDSLRDRISSDRADIHTESMSLPEVGFIKTCRTLGGTKALVDRCLQVGFGNHCHSWAGDIVHSALEKYLQNQRVDLTRPTRSEAGALLQQ